MSDYQKRQSQLKGARGMTTHYIQTLGVAKCREILGSALDKTAFYDIENNKNISIEDASIAMIFLSHRFLIMDDLRTELDQYDTYNAERKAGYRL